MGKSRFKPKTTFHAVPSIFVSPLDGRRKHHGHPHFPGPVNVPFPLQHAAPFWRLSPDPVPDKMTPLPEMQRAGGTHRDGAGRHAAAPVRPGEVGTRYWTRPTPESAGTESTRSESRDR